MEPGQALAYGVVQGLTEFLPVSSSGHLVLTAGLLGIESTGVTLEVMVHFGTLLAVLAVYWKDIQGMLVSIYRSLFSGEMSCEEKMHHKGNIRLVWLLILSTLPAVIVGLLFKSKIERFFESSLMVGAMLLITGVVLFLVSRVRQGTKTASKMGYACALGIGLAQVFAMLPGISRSGMTVAAGLFAGLTREEAAKFSFLLSIPVILGATVLELKDISSAGLGGISPTSLVLAVCAAFVSGYLAIKVLLKVLQSGNLRIFSYYCWIIGVLVILTHLY